MRVLVDGPSDEVPNVLIARHQGQAPDIDGVVFVNEGNPKIGEFAQVLITDFHEYDLVGRIV